jgi:HEAT repeat protein
MSAGNDAGLKLVHPRTEPVRSLGAVLADLYKALRSVGFYPPGHPRRDKILETAHKSLQSWLADKELVLVITRAGFSVSDGGALVDGNQMSQALAGELFIRRIKRLTVLRDLSVTDLRSFLQLLSLDPHKLTASGAMAQEMMARGIRTIWSNEVDLSVIWDKRQAMDESGVALAVDENDGSNAAAAETEAVSFDEDGFLADYPLEEAPELLLDELIARMDKESDDKHYQQLARMLGAKAEQLKETARCAPLFSALEALMRHSSEETRSAVQKEYAIFTLEQMADGVMMDFLLQHLESSGTIEKERIYLLLKQLGAKVAYGIIQRLCLADGLLARKALATALLRIGPPAIPPLLAMLKDERWYVVRNMVAIIGEIGCRDCVNALRPAVYHPDQRVRKEAIRSLVKIGGKDVESLIVGLMDDRDEVIVRHAVLSLGLMKSTAAVQPLIQIMEKRDIFMKRLTMKINAIQGLGRIGDKRATPNLLKVLTAHDWLPWSRWDELKIAAAIALGQLGDEAALPLLKVKASGGGRLGTACSEAVDNIERVAEGTV